MGRPWRVNITPAERAGRIVVGALGVVGGAILLASAESALAVILEILLVLAGLDLLVTGALGHCPLYQKLDHVPTPLRGRTPGPARHPRARATTRSAWRGPEKSAPPRGAQGTASRPEGPDQSRSWWALGALALALLVIGLDTTVVVTALPTLSQQLAASTSQLQWVTNAYTLVMAGLILPGGALGDRLGRRRLLGLGLVVFGVGSAAASQVGSAAGLIALRAVMGVGGALIVSLAFAILPTLFSEERRARAVSVLAATVFIGVPLGPLVAGWLLNRYSWGSIFLINVPVVLVALLGLYLLVPESGDDKASRIDWPGAALSVAGVTTLVYGIIEQPILGWGAPRVIAGMVMGVLLLCAFVAWQLRTPAPLVYLGLFRNRRFSWATLAFTVVGFGIGGVMFVLTPYVQVVQGNDAQATGLRLLPLVIGIAAGALPSDRLTARFSLRVTLPAGLVIASVGSAVLSSVRADTGFVPIGAGEALIGLGLGLSLAPAAEAILGALPVAETGVGFALTRTLQFVAMSFGVAVLGSVLNAAYRDGLVGHLTGLSTAARASVEGSVAQAISVPHAFTAARSAYADGMGEVMLVTAFVLVTAAALIAVFLPSRGKAAGWADRPRAELFADGHQEISVQVKGGYHPGVIRVTAGVPVRLDFRREEATACSETVVFDDFGVRADLPEGRVVPVQLLPTRPGEYVFTCGMTMLQGRLVVEPD